MNKKDALDLLNNLPDNAEVNLTVVEDYSPYVPSGYIINTFNVSRQVLSYWARQGYVKTIKCGKQNRYLLDDILKIKK
jgi:hypothetical protein